MPDDSRSTFWPKLAPKMGWKPGTRIHNYHCLLWGVPFSLRSVCSESDQGSTLPLPIGGGFHFHSGHLWRGGASSGHDGGTATEKAAER